jgi:hypothetical protein
MVLGTEGPSLQVPSELEAQQSEPLPRTSLVWLGLRV